MSDLGSESRPLRVAVVGSGPSGFYAIEALQKAELSISVELFERLPCPYGLVRLGVAPDHPKIKNVTRIYEKIAAREGFHFWGNVEIGRDLSVDEMRMHFDAVIFAHGAESDRRLGIPGEDLNGSHTATEFVAWYNGHPDYRDREFDLSQEVVAVIGQGNVAVDVCRILGKTVDELRNTDIAQHALDALAESRVREIHMIGRRGPVQAKFSQLELKELGKLDACEPVVDPSELELDPISEQEYADPKNKSAQKLMPILQAFSQRDEAPSARKLLLRFFRSPVEVQGADRVERLVLARNHLVGEPFKSWAEPTEQTETLACGLVFRSVGYRGSPVPGLPFNEKSGTVPHADGRVLDGEAPLAGVYVVGWSKRGPSGIIGTNKPDSAATVNSLLEDVQNLQPSEHRDSQGIATLCEERSVRVVSFAGWKKIDTVEVERGERVGKPREKMTRIEDMLAVAIQPK